MSTRILTDLADCAPAHRSKTSPESPITDIQLDSAVTEAGERPERAEALAEDLGIGSDEFAVLPELCAPTLNKVLAALRKPSQARFTAYGSPLAQALHGDGMFYPPYCCYDDVEDIPEGAFDAGLERVIAVDAAMGDKELHSLRSQVERSYPLARYVSVLSNCITDGNDIDSAAWYVREIAAACFRAGWIKGGQAIEVATEERAARKRATGRVAELADLLRRKIGLGAVSREEITGLGYWTDEQFDQATRTIRLEQYPGDYADFYAGLDRGLSDAEAWEESGKMQKQRSTAQPAPDFPECGAEDREFHCTSPAGHEGEHAAENDQDEVVHRWPATPPSEAAAGSGGTQ